MPIVQSFSGQVLDDVYILEVASPPTIQGVQVGIVGLVGTFQQGISGAVYTVNDYPTAVRMLGRSSSEVGGPIAIQNLLRQNAGSIRVTPVFGSGATAASINLYDDQATPGLVGTLTAAQPHPQSGEITELLGTGPNSWTVSIDWKGDASFNIKVSDASGSISEAYSGLTLSNWVSTVNSLSTAVIASQPATPSINRPASGSYSFGGGSIGNLSGGAFDTAIVGTSNGSGSTGIARLAAFAPGTINFALAAEAYSSTVNDSLVALAASNDCIAVVCANKGLSVAQVVSAKGSVSEDNVVFVDGWTYCYDADLAANRLCAPTSLVAGMASQLSPQSAFGNKPILRTLGLQVSRSREELSTLQTAGVLCLSNTIPAGGFGTRSGIATDGTEAYVRRMRYFLEYSVMNSMGWAVDALQGTSPNDPLRASVKQALDRFLSGLAYPVDPTQRAIDSFVVTCNTTNNPPESVAAGILNVSVVVRLLAAAKQVRIACNISTSAITTTSTVA